MKIVEAIGVPALLEQLAEECTELGKAALKLSRILRKENPNPVTREEALANLQEESQDVQDCLELLWKEAGIKTFDRDQHIRKMERWEDRINSVRG